MNYAREDLRQRLNLGENELQSQGENIEAAQILILYIDTTTLVFGEKLKPTVYWPRSRDGWLLHIFGPMAAAETSLA